MKIEKTILTIFFLLFCNCVVNAQVDSNSWYDILGKYDNKDAVISSWKTTYEFEMIDGQNIPQVKKNDLCKIIPLQSNRISRVYFSTSHEKIQSYKIKTDRRKIRSHPLIGDNNSPGVFQGDSKFYQFAEYLKSTEEYLELQVVSYIDDIRFCVNEIVVDNDMYVKNRVIEIIQPDWLDLDIGEFHLSNLNVKKTVEQVENGAKKITYLISDVSAPIKSDYSPSFNYEVAHLLFLPKRYNNANLEGEWNSILSDTKDLYKWYKEMLGTLSYDDFEGKNKLSEILDGSVSKQDSIRSIFYWVQDHIRYIAFEKGINGFRPQEANLVFKNKYGDCKGMANLLKAMLQSVGFDTRLAWMGTRDLPYSYQISSIAVDNHMICVLMDGEKRYYLDATEQFVSLDDCGERIQGKEILIENGDSFIIDTIPIDNTLYPNEYYKFDIALEENDLSGDFLFEFTGESKRSLMHMLSSQKITDHRKIIKYILKDESDATFNLNKEQSISFARDSSLVIDDKVSSSDALMSFGDKLYIGIADLAPYFNPEIDTTKCNKICFYRSIHQNTDVNLSLPKNMEVNRLPDPIIVKYKDCSFKGSFEKSKDEIIYQSSLKIPYRVFDHDELIDLFKIFKTQSNYRKQKITLKKKS